MFENESNAFIPVSFSNPSQAPRDLYGSSIVLLTNPDSNLYRMELTLRGMILDEKDRPRKIAEALLNDKGVYAIVGICQSIINQVTIMSNLTLDEIRGALMLSLNDTLCLELMVNRVYYNINSASARYKIKSICMHSCYICMKRAYEGDDKRFWKGSQQDITMRHEGEGAQKKSGIAGFLGWGGK